MNTPQQPNQNPNKKRRRFRNRNRSGSGGQQDRDGQNQGQQQNRGQHSGQQNRSQGQGQQGRGQQQHGQKGKQPPKGQQQLQKGQQQPQKSQQQQQTPDVVYKPGPPKRYGVVFFDSLFAAKADMDALRQKASEVDQLNIIIRAESDMDDLELTKIGKVFAGAAWALIHERRVEEGWYNEPH